MKSKRFELLKEYPYMYGSGTYLLPPHTTTVIEREFYYEHTLNDRGDKVYFGKNFVENNPLWFKEIKDTEESSKPFVWTDELVSEFAIYWRGKGGSSKYAIETFKHSQSIPAGKGTANDVLNDDTFKIVFSRTDSWQKNIDILKNAMLKEGYGLADIPPNEKPPKQNSEGKDWEIMEMRSKNGGRYGAILDRDNDWDVFLNNKNYHIHSVKRLSDGEVFSVGDTVCWGTDRDFRDKIKSFYISKVTLSLLFDSEHIDGMPFDEVWQLEKISKPQSKQESKSEIKYTQKDLDDAVGKALFSSTSVTHEYQVPNHILESVFNAARETDSVLCSGSRNYIAAFYAKYPTFKDFITRKQ